MTQTESHDRNEQPMGELPSQIDVTRPNYKSHDPNESQDQGRQPMRGLPSQTSRLSLNRVPRGGRQSVVLWPGSAQKLLKDSNRVSSTAWIGGGGVVISKGADRNREGETSKGEGNRNEKVMVAGEGRTAKSRRQRRRGEEAPKEGTRLFSPHRASSSVAACLPAHRDGQRESMPVSI